MARVKFFKRFRRRLIFVGQNSGFHGLNRLFNPYAILLSRLFWLSVIIASIGGVYMMMEPVVELGMEINYTPDTRYLDWTTKFPGVTVCDEEDFSSQPQAQRDFAALYPALFKQLNFDQQRYLANVLFARGKCSNDQCSPCGTTVPCDLPWRSIIERVRKSGDEFITECRYNEVEFPCKQHFKRVDSEHGPCFAFNTLQHKGHKNLFSVNRTTGSAVLTFRLLSRATISIHSTEELLTNSLDAKLKQVVMPPTVNHVEWLFSIVDIDNDLLLRNVRVDQRGCHFLHEVPDERLYIYPVYSYGACRLARSTKEIFAHCGCIHPARDISYKDFYCNYTGINCWNSVKEDEAKKDDCLPSCVESELTTVHFAMKWVPENADKDGALVKIQMASLPTLRYQRNLRRTQLDLVVSVGGIAGLFFSASVLSFLEVFYLMFRPQKFDNVK